MQYNYTEATQLLRFPVLLQRRRHHVMLLLHWNMMVLTLLAFSQVRAHLPKWTWEAQQL